MKSPSDPNRGHVLIVDDESSARLTTEAVLSDDFDVALARSGEEALEHMRRGPFEVVVTDLVMPGMSGLDAARALRQDASMDGLPIIMLTARAQESDIEQGFEAGADDYIVKPFSPRELASRVSAVLARSR